MKISTSRIYSLLLLKLISFIFPPTLKVERNLVTLSTHDSLLIFWDTNEDTVFLREITAINHNPGIIWDKLIVDSKSGTNSVIIRGLKKSEAKKFKKTLLLMSGN